MNWEAVIGLEVHVQLATRSKLFSGCPVSTTAPPNTAICAVSLGLPGSLPVLNERAVQLAVRAALAFDCDVHPVSAFARKHYFYPDLPKGYQITQFDAPVATGGRLAVPGQTPVRLNRIHLEEDAGKSVHDRAAHRTALDFNRAGTPLIEIVTEPDLRSARDARSFLTALKQILEYVEVSDCDMEKGHLRVDANVSVRPRGESALGVKQELKNLNSFSAVERGIELVLAEQIAAAERGDVLVPSTYSAATGTLRLLRSKEDSRDYRYFPDPDLPPLVLDPAWLRSAREELPELPAARERRLVASLGVSAADANVVCSTRALADYFEAVVAVGLDGKTAVTWVLGPVLRDVNTEGRFRVAPSAVGRLADLVADGVVSFQAAKRVFGEIADRGPGTSPKSVAEELGLVQVRDPTNIDTWIDAVLSRHDDAWRRAQAGERKLLGFLIGEVMKESGRAADPKLVREALVQRLPAGC